MSLIGKGAYGCVISPFQRISISKLIEMIKEEQHTNLIYKEHTVKRQRINGGLPHKNRVCNMCNECRYGKNCMKCGKEKNKDYLKYKKCYNCYFEK